MASYVQERKKKSELALALVAKFTVRLTMAMSRYVVRLVPVTNDTPCFPTDESRLRAVLAALVPR